MKKINVLNELKIILTFLLLIVSVSFVKGNIRLSIFSLIALLFTIFSISYSYSLGLETVKNLMKFFISFLNITTLFYFVEYFTKINYFDSVIKIVYRPFFEKGIRTSIFMILIFLSTTLVLIWFNRLNLGEDNGEEREQKKEKEENF